MAWQAHDPNDARNAHFPSWTWLNHMSAIWPGAPSLGRLGVRPESCPFDLTFCTLDSSTAFERRKGFEQPYDSRHQEYRDVLPEITLSDSSSLEANVGLGVPAGLQELQHKRLLFFESFAFHFAVQDRWEKESNEFHPKVVASPLMIVSPHGAETGNSFGCF
jgi:hypothetical protein